MVWSPPLIQQLKKIPVTTQKFQVVPKICSPILVINMGDWKKFVTKSNKPNYLGISPNYLAIARIFNCPMDHGLIFSIDLMIEMF